MEGRKHRLLAWVLTLSLILGLVPTAWATEGDPLGQDSGAPECVCTELCTADSMNGDCPVCGADAANCGGEAPVDEETAAVQEKIDALPTLDGLEAMTDEEQQAAYMEIQAAHDAYQALTAEQQAQITGADALEALLAYFTELAEPLQDNTGHFVVNNTELTTDGVYTGYTFYAANNKLVIWDSTPLTISGGTESAPITGSIVVEPNVTANLTFNGLYLKGEDGDDSVPDAGTAAVDIQNKATLNLTLAGNVTNTLKGGLYCAGIQVPADATLNISCETHGSGNCAETDALQLSVEGGDMGAGIGGGSGQNCGTVCINGGRLSVTSGTLGAGIGGGNSGNGGKVTINGGVVTAVSGAEDSSYVSGAGIGGGNDGSGGSIVINGGVVTATSWGGGAGIGGGPGDYDRPTNGGTITITGGTVTAVCKDWGGAGIGGGGTGNSGEVTITGGTVKACGGGSSVNANEFGAGIGGGAGGDGGIIVILGGTVKAFSGGDSAQNIGGGVITGSHAAVGDSGTGIRPEEKTDQPGHFSSTEYGVLGDVTLPNPPSQYTIPQDATLKIPQGTSLTIPEGVTLTNNGTITGAGSLVVKGDVTGSGNLSGVNVTKKTQGAPSAPALIGTPTENSVTVSAVSGQKYMYTTENTKPETTADGWEVATGIILTFSGLAADTTYYIWTYKPGNSYYEDSPVSDGLQAATSAATHAVSVSANPKDGGSASASLTKALQGTSITLTAEAKDGYHFKEWTSTDISISDADKGKTPLTFTMPGNDVEVNAVFEAHSFTKYVSNNNGTHQVVCKAEGCDYVDQQAVACSFTGNTCTLCGYTKQSSSVPPSGGSSGSSSYTPQSDYTTSAASISRTTSRSDLNWLIRNGKTLTLKCSGAEMSFRPEALQAIVDALPQSSSSATFAAAPFTGTLPNGARTAYDFTLTDSGKKPLEVTFPAGSVTIGVAYTPGIGEDAWNLYLAYVDGNRLERVQGSAYKGGTVSGDVAHFSTYAVAYEEPVQPWANPFTDVSEGEWCYESVKFVHQNGLMNGTSDTTFSPNLTTSRAMIATILWRQAGSPVVNYAMRFDDVDVNAYYAEAVRWAASEGIVSGYGNGKYGPDDPITREQLAVMLYNYEKKRGGGFNGAWAFRLDFPDVASISEWAYEPMCWCVMNGIITGTSGGRLNPGGNATRAETAAMLQRYLEQ